ncbi:hypothetical protein KPL42_11925 [Clostridium gasigenes]|uniref:hypothetical protein n=1 Tax=Clostridium gasigenes TaxID=94869 RepID=UPI001C0BAFA3|nr:hypothetical protein [Clostridium gasigenes]MBU3089195.1 hypothetical protein [Clostridium gasigenes]
MKILKDKPVIVVTEFDVVYTGTVLGVITNNHKKYIKLKPSIHSEVQILFPIDEITTLILENSEVITGEQLEQYN